MCGIVVCVCACVPFVCGIVVCVNLCKCACSFLCVDMYVRAGFCFMHVLCTSGSRSRSSESRCRIDPEVPNLGVVVLDFGVEARSWTSGPLS